MPKKIRDTHSVRVRVEFGAREACVIMLCRALAPKSFAWAKLSKTEVLSDDGIAMTLMVEKERMRSKGWGFYPGTQKPLADLVALTMRDDAFEVAKRKKVPCSLAYLVDPIPF